MSLRALVANDDTLARQRVMDLLEHALQSFDARALNDLLKTFGDDRFDEALSSLKAGPIQNNLGELQLGTQQVHGDPAYPRKLAFKTNGRIVIVATDSVDWINAERDYVRIHVGNDTHLVRATMSKIHAKLPAHKFVRIHRSTIVNVDCIAELRPIFGGEYSVRLHNGTKLTLSRGYRKGLTSLIPN